MGTDLERAKQNKVIEDSVVSILETTAADGKLYSPRFYNIADFDEAFAKYLKGGDKS